MRVMVTIGYLIGCIVLITLPINADEVEEFITSDILTASDVEPYVKNYIETRKSSTFGHIMGIYQPEDNKKHAKIFFKYRKKKRTEGPFERGEINCFQVNSGKWYCGGNYEFLEK